MNSRNKKPRKIRVLGFDPGPKNFGCFAGYIVLKHDMPLLKVQESFMLENTVQDLTDNLTDTIEPYLNEMRELIDDYHPHVIVMERFMTRGFKGKTIEFVNIMIGALSALVNSYRAKGINIKLITPTAASWKNRVNKFVDLKTMYKVLKRYGIPDHQVDASLMPLYVLKRYDNPYSFLGIKDRRNHYIRSLINTHE